MKLRLFGAGLGAAALAFAGTVAGLGANPAFADDPTVEYDDVKIGKTLISNDTVFADTSKAFTFSVTAAPCDADGCVAASDIPAISNVTVNVTEKNEKASSASFLPSKTTYTKPGVYAWTVKEALTNPDSELKVSQAEYYIKAAIKNGDNGLDYQWITITKVKNDDGTANGGKVNNLDFININEDTTTFEIGKTVINDGGRPEEPTYQMNVVFTIPENFNASLNPAANNWSPTVPAVAPAQDTEATGTTCGEPVSGKITCSFSVAKDKKAKFTGVPVGAEYEVTETTEGDFEPAYSAKKGTVTETPVTVTVTNTYADIPPTGVLLSYAPYALMVIIPVAALAGYVVVRRKITA
ncbi:MAG: hypothetical protein J6M18_06940 [Actinomycetaceae bacterium]|nr:hypothetical protein [Actinomycetaceae bacterium]